LLFSLLSRNSSPVPSAIIDVCRRQAIARACRFAGAAPYCF
jgi:hypothetical protein